MMVRAGYKRDTCTGLIAAGNILSPIMPPSVPMIIFGVQAGVSVTKLFMGGIAPVSYTHLERLSYTSLSELRISSPIISLPLVRDQKAFGLQLLLK